MSAASVLLSAAAAGPDWHLAVAAVSAVAPASLCPMPSSRPIPCLPAALRSPLPSLALGRKKARGRSRLCSQVSCGVCFRVRLQRFVGGGFGVVAGSDKCSGSARISDLAEGVRVRLRWLVWSVLVAGGPLESEVGGESWGVSGPGTPLALLEKIMACLFHCVLF